MCDILQQNIHDAVYAVPWGHQQNKTINTAYFLQGFIRMDMSEFQEKHEVSLPAPNMLVSWLERITALTHAIFNTLYCETDSSKLKGFIEKDVHPIAFPVMYIKGLGDN